MGPLVVLSKRRRVREALAARPERECTPEFLLTFIREKLSQCRCTLSAARGWEKLSSSASRASWLDATQQEYVVTLKEHPNGNQDKATDVHMVGEWCSSQEASSDDACDVGKLHH